jgi:hypothetical protein
MLLTLAPPRCGQVGHYFVETPPARWGHAESYSCSVDAHLRPARDHRASRDGNALAVGQGTAGDFRAGFDAHFATGVPVAQAAAGYDD